MVGVVGVVGRWSLERGVDIEVLLRKRGEIGSRSRLARR